MKKHLLILLTALLSTMPLLAQYSPCYEAAFAEGKRLFNEGKYNKAKTYFNEAKDCPDHNATAIDEWIGKCDKMIRKAEEARQKAEQERIEAERKAREEARQKELQYSSCYEAAFAEGQKQFKAGNYTKAKTYFNEAKYCPNPNIKAINEMLEKCENAIQAEAEKENVQISISGSVRGNDYVDLGLPSGTLWATCNIGASNPEDFGEYYAWGETQTKSTYTWENYRYAQGTSWSDPRLTKYCSKSDMGNNGFTDDLMVLQGSDDPAVVIWGGGWHTPSYEQWEELMMNTKEQWTERNGVKGRLFTSRNNGQTLFLPAAGSLLGSEPYDVGSSCFYWSSKIVSLNPAGAWAYDSVECDTAGNNRSCGQPVRPVREK